MLVCNVDTITKIAACTQKLFTLISPLVLLFNQFYAIYLHHFLVGKFVMLNCVGKVSIACLEVDRFA